MASSTDTELKFARPSTVVTRLNNAKVSSPHPSDPRNSVSCEIRSRKADGGLSTSDLQQLALHVCMPSSAANLTSSDASLDFPTPASPLMTLAPPLPVAAAWS